LTGLTRALSGSAPGLACGSPLGGRWGVTPCLPSSAAVVVVAGHPGDLPQCESWEAAVVAVGWDPGFGGLARRPAAAVWLA
jgi:hypothetical protein